MSGIKVGVNYFWVRTHDTPPSLHPKYLRKEDRSSFLWSALDLKSSSEGHQKDDTPSPTSSPKPREGKIQPPLIGPDTELIPSRMRELFINFSKNPLLLLLLILLVCSLDTLSSVFQLAGGKIAGDIFKDNVVLPNPLARLVVQILVTVPVQSSSTSTSIIMCVSVLEVHSTVPTIMGSNIRMSVTNTILDMMQGEMDSFSFTTIHYCFNWLSVLVLLPMEVEVATGLMTHLAHIVVTSFNIQSGEVHVITAIAMGDESMRNRSLVKHWCHTNLVTVLTSVNTITVSTLSPPHCHRCHHCHPQTICLTTSQSQQLKGNTLKFHQTDNLKYERSMGSLALLCSCLVLLFKLIKVKRQILQNVETKYERHANWPTGYLTMFVGAGMTFIVQSSSLPLCSHTTYCIGEGPLARKHIYLLHSMLEIIMNREGCL
uniref:Sodium-dependent phosphate transport protein 2A n=1 Tax=Oncorhynchus tshawytscha TaxID=74940 RepID=A0A8C8FQZ3_ONCTS